MKAKTPVKGKAPVYAEHTYDEVRTGGSRQSGYAADAATLGKARLTKLETATLAKLYFDGYTHRELAEMEGVSASAIQSRVESAMRKLDAAGIPRPACIVPHVRRKGKVTCTPMDPAMFARLSANKNGTFVDRALDW